MFSRVGGAVVCIGGGFVCLLGVFAVVLFGCCSFNKVLSTSVLLFSFSCVKDCDSHDRTPTERQFPKHANLKEKKQIKSPS